MCTNDEYVGYETFVVVMKGHEPTMLMISVLIAATIMVIGVIQVVVFSRISVVIGVLDIGVV